MSRTKKKHGNISRRKRNSNKLTIEEFLQEITTVFKKVGIENPGLEAQLLASHVLSVDRFYLFLHKDEELDDKVLLASAALINERCKRRPLQYIVGKANFFGIDLAVDERVLIPRPETEELVEAALKLMKDKNCPSVLDLCTGSGCIACAVAANREDAAITASEYSLKAYQLASYNCRPYENIKLKRADLLEGLDVYDFILTNPPYIPTDAIEGLQPEVKDFEPEMALDGGRDGLNLIRRIIDDAPEHLNPKAWILMEIGDDQGEAVLEYAKNTKKYTNLEIMADLEGKNRVFKAQKA